MKPIKVLEPTFDDATIKAMSDVLRSGWVGQGPVTAEFEAAFAKRVGVKHAIATNSGTAALDLAIKAFDLKRGELITTPMTFVADAIVGEWNDMRVTFADIQEDTLCLDPAAIEIKKDTQVIIAVHSHGRLADIAGMRKKFGGLIIEDCAHAAFTPGAGLMGDIAIWSFQAVKTLPAGDGGMVTTNDDAIAQKIRNMTWLGIEKSTYSRVNGKKYSWDYDITHGGQKAYMNDLNAVLALGNLRRIDEILQKRQRIQKNYNAALAGLPGVTLPIHSDTVQYYTLRTKHRDAIGERLAEDGVSTSVHFKPLHLMTYWKGSQRGPLPVTDRVWPELLSLPCHDALTWDEQAFVIDKFTKAVYVEMEQT